MVNQQLLAYVKQQLAAGVAKADLQKTTAAAGWAAQDISDTFAVAEGRAPAPAPAPAPVPAPVAPVLTPPVRLGQVPAQPVVPPAAQPIAKPPVQPPVVQPAAPVAAAPVAATPSAPATPGSWRDLEPKKRLLWPWITGAVVLVLVAAASALYFLPGVRTQIFSYLPFLPQASTEPVVQEEPAPIIPATQTLSGEYVLQKQGTTTTGFFRPALPEAPAVASTTVAPPEIRYMFGGQDSALQAQLFGTTTPQAKCSLSIDTSLEIKDPAPLRPGEVADTRIELKATFVGLVSKGKMYDLCPGATANSIIKTERQ